MMIQAIQQSRKNNREAYKEINVHFEPEQSALWFYMKNKNLPCFSVELLSDLTTLFHLVKNKHHHYSETQYIIAASSFPNVYSLGGDLEYFSQCIKSSAQEELRQYAYNCIDLGYLCHRQFEKDITSIALVQGSALGGGFEAALSCNILIAEEKSMLGFPEINFNLFPGMGAFSYLCRRVSISQAEEMILSGKQYSAKELFEYGIVDVLAKDGEGEKATQEFIKNHRIKQHARIAIEKAKSHIMPITLTELYEIADVWVDAAIKIKPESLDTMKRLIAIQRRKFNRA
jgi:DSF synthase